MLKIFAGNGFEVAGSSRVVVKTPTPGMFKNVFLFFFFVLLFGRSVTIVMYAKSTFVTGGMDVSLFVPFLFGKRAWNYS